MHNQTTARPTTSFWSNLIGALLFVSFSSIAVAETSLRIEPEALYQQLKSQKVTLVDARSPESYAQNHIADAVNFPEPETYINKSENGRIVAPGVIQKKLRALGLDKNNEIVIYDNGGLMAAARVFWTLEVYGFNNVKILNQGLEGWINRNYQVTQQLPLIKPSNYIASINHNRLATKLKTQIATQSPKQVIVDARPNIAYIGKKSSAKRFGHIPTAVNIPADHNLEGNDSLKSLQPTSELQKLYADIPRDSKVVLYCAIGRISSTNYLVLRELGYDVANYDASWKEWGNDFSLPISLPASSTEEK